LANKPLSVVWTKHLKSDEHKQTFEQTLRASTTIVQRLREILEDDERSLDAASATIKDFEDPSWSHKQAFRLGEKARIRKLKELLDFI
jgi:hypothetical protein